MTKTADQMNGPSAKQINLIDTLLLALDVDEDTRHVMISNVFGVISIRFLTQKQAKIFQDVLQNEAEKRGISTPLTLARKYDKLKGRKGMATVTQLIKIEELWNNIAVAMGKKEKSRDRGLRPFIAKTVNVSDIRFLTKTNATKTIKALNHMLSVTLRRET